MATPTKQPNESGFVRRAEERAVALPSAFHKSGVVGQAAIEKNGSTACRSDWQTRQGGGQRQDEERAKAMQLTLPSATAELKCFTSEPEQIHCSCRLGSDTIKAHLTRNKHPVTLL